MLPPPTRLAGELRVSKSLPDLLESSIGSDILSNKDRVSKGEVQQRNDGGSNDCCGSHVEEEHEQQPSELDYRIPLHSEFMAGAAHGSLNTKDDVDSTIEAPSHEVPPEACGVCLELDAKRLRKSLGNLLWINYFNLRENVETCPFCALLMEALCQFNFEEYNAMPSEGDASHIVLTRTDASRIDVDEQSSTLVLRWPNREIEFYTNTDNTDLPTSIKKRDHLSSTLNDSLRQKVASWIGCLGGMSPLPARVLDLSLGGSDDVTLYESSGELGSYATLSHCWVNRQILKTGTRSLSSHLSGISFQSLPPTFRNAVLVCRWLGVRYLWIDALCIVQDDPQDVGRQVSNMDQIFRNAFFTIATHGSSERQTILPESPLYHELTVRNHKVYTREIFRHDFLQSQTSSAQIFSRGRQDWTEIHTRGWCFQERLLSRQVLHFTPYEILYERDGNLEACQCLHHRSDMQPQIQLVSSSSSEAFNRWQYIVKEYCELMFTHKTDLLPGLAGVARLFHLNSTPNSRQYIAGLWENNLLESLCWCSAYYLMGPEPTVPERYVLSSNSSFCPSFSWASRFGPIDFFTNGPYTQNASNVATLLRIHNHTDPVNPFGRWLSCSLELRGNLLPARSFSTAGKDQKYLTMNVHLKPGLEEAYIAPLTVAERNGLCHCDDDQRFEKLQKYDVSYQYDIDAYNEIPEENALVYLFPLRESVD